MAAIAGAKLPSSTKAVLYALAYHADFQTGLAFPSVSLLAYEAGLSERSAFRAIAHAEQQGAIKIPKRGGGVSSTGVGRANEYVLDLPGLRKLNPDTVAGFTPSKGDTVSVEPCQIGDRTLTPWQQNPDTVAYKQTIEQTIENTPTTTRDAVVVARAIEREGQTEKAKSLGLLVDAGVLNGTARALAEKFSLEEVEAGLDWLKGRKGLTNRAGMLVTIMQDGTATQHVPKLRTKREAAERDLQQRRYQRYVALGTAVSEEVTADPARAATWTGMREFIGTVLGSSEVMARSEVIPDAVLLDHNQTARSVMNVLYRSAQERASTRAGSAEGAP